MRHAFAYHILESVFTAIILFLGTAPIFVHKQNVGVKGIRIVNKIQDAGPSVDSATSNAAQSFKHESPLSLIVDRETTLELVNSFIRPYPHIHITVVCCLHEECNMSTVEHIETARDKNLFSVVHLLSF